MKTACAYIRVSDERQDEYSPDSQLKLIRQYCAENSFFLPENYIFYDDGISAKSSANRTAFLEMLELAKSKEHPVDAIVVWKFSRFARNQEESILLKSVLKRAGVQVLSVSEPLSNDPFGTLIERIIEWMDEYYVIRLSGEVKRGMTEKAMRGEINGAPPIGYRIEKGTLLPCSGERETVKRIFALFLGGLSPREVARSLNDQGLHTRKGALFDSRSIVYILRNPIYMGYTRWSRSGRMASARQFQSDCFILAKGSHEPLVSERDFTLAAARLDAEACKHDYPLRGLLFCGDCGAKMLRSGSKSRFFQCGKYAAGKGCFSHGISEKKLYALIIGTAEDIFWKETIETDALSAREKNEKIGKRYKKILLSKANGTSVIRFIKQS